MMYKNLIILIFWTYSSTELFAQNGYSVLNYFKYQNNAYNILEVVNDTAYIKSEIGLGGNSPIIYVVHPSIFKVNINNGKILKIISPFIDSNLDLFSNGYGTHTLNNGFAAIGQLNTSLGTYFVEYNKSGQIKNKEFYAISDTYRFSMQNIIQTPDSNYYMFGSSYHEITKNKDLSLSKVNKNGKLIWRKQYENDDIIDVPVNLYLLKNKNILLSFGKLTSIKCYPFHEAESSFFLEIDSTGNALKRLTDITHKQYIQSLIEIDNKSLILGSIDIDSIDCTYPGTEEFYCHMGITKIDSNFKSIWKIKMPISKSHKKIYRIKKLTDNNYIAVGYDTDSTFLKTEWGMKYGVIIKFTENGTLIWRKKYYKHIYELSGANESEITDISELPNGDLFLVGNVFDRRERTDTTYHFERFWTLRLNKNGDLDTARLGLLNMEKPKDIYIYPNLANQFFIVENIVNNLTKYKKHLTIRIFQISGSEVYSQKIDANSIQTVVLTNNLASGQYYVKIFDSYEKDIYTEKLQIEH